MPDFTKGTWCYADVSTPYEQNFIIGTLDPNGVFYALGSARNETNARLITAAPEMYDLLYDAMQELKGYKPIENGISTIWPDIEELLARIDGKEN